MSASPINQDIVLDSYCQLLISWGNKKDSCKFQMPTAPDILEYLSKKDSIDQLYWRNEEKKNTRLRLIQRALVDLKINGIIPSKLESEDEKYLLKMTKEITTQARIEERQKIIKTSQDREEYLSNMIKYYSPLFDIIIKNERYKKREYVIFSEEEKNKIDDCLEKDLLLIYSNEICKEWENISYDLHLHGYKISESFIQRVRGEYAKYVIESYQNKIFLCELLS